MNCPFFILIGAEKGWYLQTVSHCCDLWHLGWLVNIGEHGQAKLLFHLAQPGQARFYTRASIPGLDTPSRSSDWLCRSWL